ncbi:hypothetical protein ASZ90_008264 [hydrocarbon metagenome]|uniref:Uncharacterized protein n=1 Tax=hydrocarbon metagenome TaxID=938273 RepID=A0A0W8FMJ4_9ZZZZ
MFNTNIKHDAGIDNRFLTIIHSNNYTIKKLLIGNNNM